MQQWHIENKRMTDIIFNSNKSHMIWFAQKLSFCQCRRTHFKWSSRSRVPTFSNGIYGVSVMTNGVWYCKISRICDVRLVQKNNFHWLQGWKWISKKGGVICQHVKLYIYIYMYIYIYLFPNPSHAKNWGGCQNARGLPKCEKLFIKMGTIKIGFDFNQAPMWLNP